MKSKIRIITIAVLATMLGILGIVFSQTRPQNNPILVGSWKSSSEWHPSTLIFYEDGRGRIKPEVHSISWRTRNGQLILTSMGVNRYFEYSVYDDTKLVLVSHRYNGSLNRSTYVRIEQ